jgi:bifunctional ADP-heptose synthase (sugar kinase/adenylyltransferase)
MPLAAAPKPSHHDRIDWRSWQTETDFSVSAGAGDSLFTCAAMAIRAGIDIWSASYLGALAAACQVGRVGNIPVTTADIEAEIDADEG